MNLRLRAITPQSGFDLAGQAGVGYYTIVSGTLTATIDGVPNSYGTGRPVLGSHHGDARHPQSRNGAGGTSLRAHRSGRAVAGLFPSASQVVDAKAQA